jgi:hypothetical protein
MRRREAPLRHLRQGLEGQDRRPRTPRLHARILPVPPVPPRLTRTRRHDPHPDCVYDPVEGISALTPASDSPHDRIRALEDQIGTSPPLSRSLALTRTSSQPISQTSSARPVAPTLPLPPPLSPSPVPPSQIRPRSSVQHPTRARLSRPTTTSSARTAPSPRPIQAPAPNSHSLAGTKTCPLPTSSTICELCLPLQLSFPSLPPPAPRSFSIATRAALASSTGPASFPPLPIPRPIQITPTPPSSTPSVPPRPAGSPTKSPIAQMASVAIALQNSMLARPALTSTRQ